MPNNLSKENIIKLNKAIQLLDEAVEIGNTAISKFPKKECKFDEYMFLGYQERFVSGFQSITLLLREFQKKRNIETSIGLIIRTSLLDYITMTYLLTYYLDISDKDPESKNKYDNQVNIIIIDHIRNSLRYFKKCKDNKSITEVEYKELLDSTWHNYGPMFSTSVIDYVSPEKKLITSEHRTTSDLFQRIHTHPATKPYSAVYGSYIYYSKYEHLGIMTMPLQRQGINHDFTMTISSMKYMFHGLLACFTFLSPLNDMKLETEKIELGKIQEDFNSL